ncbi:MAG: hypothetical protein M1814_005890 [Vezdaea aestivalis]|nr:MAG: hypothetical protein M1814_005890 [Vezdaea aestivalis]
MGPIASFTIPSISDDLLLDCRIYHPKKFYITEECSNDQWLKKGAIVAHPYAPLGGSYDDAVVGMISSSLLKSGFIVGTFNFRGAAGSKGRTSWTSKPELSDYISFAGFFIHYMHYLRPFVTGRSSSVVESGLSPIESSQATVSFDTDVSKGSPDKMTLVLGGYSYGSMIVNQLPTTDTILAKFVSPQKGSAETEICLRAASLANEQNQEFESARRSHSIGKADDFHPLKLGGEESEPGTRRRSRDSRRSLDRLKRSLDISRTFSRHHKNGSDDAVDVHQEVGNSIPEPFCVYLLVSPLLPPISSLATFFSSSDNQAKSKSEVNEVDKLCSCPTLAIFGGKDMFTSPKKLHKWSDALQAISSSKFRSKEILATQLSYPNIINGSYVTRMQGIGQSKLYRFTMSREWSVTNHTVVEEMAT